MKRLLQDDNVTPPVILARVEKTPLTLVPDSDDGTNATTPLEDNIWRLSALEAQTADRDEEPA